ncbi:hypothetical protein JHK86_037233 [Glycine max]|nr:hypothetical protein JHK86_037233 [Glycine max]
MVLGREETKGSVRRIRKRTRRGTGAERNTCSTTLASNAVYSSSTSATIATSIISLSLFKQRIRVGLSLD